jgi:DNA uptake protein ComE-like DNA-binding protein
MKQRIVRSVLAATLVLSLSGGPGLAAEEKAGTAPPPKAEKATAEQKSAKAKKAAAKVKLVDINSASKAELKKIPSIGDAEADKIIAGRPHLSKADLVTKNIIPLGVYQQIKDRIIARQKPEPAAKAAGKSR